MHPCPGNWVEIGRAVVYYAWAAHAFSARNKCQILTDYNGNMIMVEPYSIRGSFLKLEYLKTQLKE